MPARWTRVLAVAAAGAATTVPTVAVAGPDAGAGATARAGRDTSGEDLSVVVAHRGTMMRTRFEGRRLVARDAGGAVLAARELPEPDRAALLAAARAAVVDPSTQWTCPVDETFVSVTVDRRTNSSAVCPDRNSWRSHPELWRAVVTLVRRLLGVGR